MAMGALRSLWLSSSAPAVEPRAEARTQPKVSAPERSVDRNILLLPNRSHGDAAGIVGLLGYGEVKGVGWQYACVTFPVQLDRKQPGHVYRGVEGAVGPRADSETIHDCLQGPAGPSVLG